MIYIILICGFFLRLWNLNQSLWLDEAINVLAVRDNSLSRLLEQYSLGDFHPPLYHLLLWGWTRIFGYSEISVRMLSVLFGVATIYASFYIFRRLFSKSIGIFTAIFLATSPLHIYYSQEARMYAETAFFALLSTGFFLKLVRGGIKSKFVFWIGYIIVTLFLVYSEYLPLYLMLAQNIVILFYAKNLDANFLKRWMLAQFILLLLYLPWIPYLWRQFQIASIVGKDFPLWNQIVGKASVKGIILLFLKFTIGRISITNKFIYGIITFLLISIILYLIAQIIRFRWKERLIRQSLFLFFITIVLSFVASIFISIFSYFRFLFLLPIFYLLLVMGITSIKRKRIQITVFAFFILLNLGSIIFFSAQKKFWREDWRSAVKFIESQEKGKSIAIMVNPAQNAPYKYYSKGLIPLVYGFEKNDIFYNKIWLFRYVQEIFDPEDKIRKEIEEKGYKRTGEYDFTGVVIWRYAI